MSVLFEVLEYVQVLLYLSLALALFVGLTGGNRR